MNKLSGLLVFLVEDETLVALLLEDMLDELGCVLAGSAASLPAALKLAGTVEADLAVLDVNVAGDVVFPVAEILASRNIPALFSTGYGEQGLPEKWRGSPILAKPYDLSNLKTALSAAPLT